MFVNSRKGSKNTSTSPVIGCFITYAFGTVPGISCCGININEWWKTAFSNKLMITTGLYLPNLSTKKPADSNSSSLDRGNGGKVKKYIQLITLFKRNSEIWNDKWSKKDKIKHDWPGVKLQQIFYLCERRTELEITVSKLIKRKIK